MKTIKTIIKLLFISILLIFPFNVRSENFYNDVVNTKHNIGLKGGDVCADCHDKNQSSTPIDSQKTPDQSQNPLWGNNANKTNIESSTNVNGIGINPSSECLACHDGLLAGDTHKFNSDLIIAQPPMGKRPTQHPFDVVYPRLTNGNFVGNLQQPLPNSYKYWSIADKDNNGIKLPSGPTSDFFNLEEGGDEYLNFSAVRTTAGRIHCDSCHNPHSDKYPPFLRSSPETLCLTCHDK